jgi:hypothetical protein
MKFSELTLGVQDMFNQEFQINGDKGMLITTESGCSINRLGAFQFDNTLDHCMTLDRETPSDLHFYSFYFGTMVEMKISKAKILNAIQDHSKENSTT